MARNIYIKKQTNKHTKEVKQIKKQIKKKQNKTKQKQDRAFPRIYPGTSCSLRITFATKLREGTNIVLTENNQFKGAPNDFVKYLFRESNIYLLLAESSVRTVNYRLFTVLYFSVRSSRSSALRYGLPSCMSVKTTQEEFGFCQ